MKIVAVTACPTGIAHTYMAAEQLQQALYFQNKFAEQLQAAQALVQLNASARNCFMLAKALAFNQRYEVAEQACLAGLKQEFRR